MWTKPLVDALHQILSDLDGAIHRIHMYDVSDTKELKDLPHTMRKANELADKMVHSFQQFRTKHHPLVLKVVELAKLRISEAPAREAKRRRKELFPEICHAMEVICGSDSEEAEVKEEPEEKEKSEGKP